MQGHPKVIETLNALLAGELMARDQYFIHSRMYEEWGYTKLAARIGHEMEDETMHADMFIKRILTLGGQPNMVPAPLKLGHHVPDMLQKDFEVELEVQQNLKDAIKLVESVGDYVTRDLLVKQLDDTENDHAHWLEQQIRLIEMLGLPNYLQSQL